MFFGEYEYDIYRTLKNAELVTNVRSHSTKFGVFFIRIKPKQLPQTYTLEN